MSLQEGFQLAAQDYFDRAAKKLAIASQPPKRPEPLLTGPQELARRSLQPDRLVAVNAAPAPLFEAARPLLNALASTPDELDAVQVDALHTPDAQCLGFDDLSQRDYVWTTWTHAPKEGPARAMDWSLPHLALILRRIEARLREEPDTRFSTLLNRIIQSQR